MKKFNSILLIGSCSAAIVLAVPFFASALISTEVAVGIYSVIGLLLIAAQDRAPRRA